MLACGPGADDPPAICRELVHHRGCDLGLDFPAGQQAGQRLARSRQDRLLHLDVTDLNQARAATGRCRFVVIHLASISQPSRNGTSRAYRSPIRGCLG